MEPKDLIRMRERQIRSERAERSRMERRVVKTEKQIEFYEQVLEPLKDRLKEQKLQVVNSSNLISTWERDLADRRREFEMKK